MNTPNTTADTIIAGAAASLQNSIDAQTIETKGLKDAVEKATERQGMTIKRAAMYGGITIGVGAVIAGGVFLALRAGLLAGAGADVVPTPVPVPVAE